MSRRIDIELTSALDDGTWTWRAAGARQPRGIVDGSILPSGVKVGDELKVEVDQEIDGITVTGVVQERQKQDRDLLELLPTERKFDPVVETRAPGGRGDRRPRRDDDRRGRRDRRDRRDRDDRGDDRGGPGRRDGRRGRDRQRDRGPSFTPPPEVPQRPKPKRLKPGKAHRRAVLAELPEEQRPIAELALQGMSAVRQRLKEENRKAVDEGRPTMPEATVLKMAEELLPTLRVAEWRDRAEAAQRQLEHLDLRDLRSVVAAAGDPMVARDESTRALAEELQAALATKQEQELVLWYGDVDAALAVGRVIRALRLSSQPPKAGVPFPTDIAQRLADSTNASLTPMDSPERWAATLEAAAFSPVRSQIRPPQKPDAVNDELQATVRRLAPALPQVAELFEIEVDPDAPMPKPLRPGPRQRPKKDGAGGRRGKQQAGGGTGRDQRRTSGRPDTPAAAPSAAEPPAADTTATAAEPAAADTTEPIAEPSAADTTATAAEPAPEPPTSETAEPTPEPAPEPPAADTTATAAEPAPEPPTSETAQPTPEPAPERPSADDAEPSAETTAEAPEEPPPA